MGKIDYELTARKILQEVGGGSNVDALTHCVTRLRFNLKDNSKANKEKILKIPLVISVLEQGGQYQVVIGNKVTAVYDMLVPLIGKKKNEIGTNEKVSKDKLSPLDIITNFIQGVFVPTLSLLTASGLLKGVLNGLSATGLVSEDNSTVLLLTAIADVIFYFFPIILGASAAKYLKMDIFIGMGIGGALVYPTVISAASNGSINNFLGIPLTMSNYSSTVFPVIFSIICAHWIQKMLKIIIPSVVSYILIPFFTLLIIIPITLAIIGPIITSLSTVLANIIVSIYNFSPIFAGLVIGGPWIIFVMLGLHWAFIPIFIMNISQSGSEPLMGLLVGNQWAMAGAALGVGMLLKHRTAKSACLTNGLTCILGVSEPSIYGVLLPLKTPFLISIIIGSIGGAIGGAFGTTNYAFGASGIFGIPSTIGSEGIDTGFIGGIVAAIVSLVLGFIITYMVMRNKRDILTEYEAETN